jgi:hypothetical protein
MTRRCSEARESWRKLTRNLWTPCSHTTYRTMLAKARMMPGLLDILSISETTGSSAMRITDAGLQPTSFGIWIASRSIILSTPLIAKWSQQQHPRRRTMLCYIPSRSALKYISAEVEDIGTAMICRELHGRNHRLARPADCQYSES